MRAIAIKLRALVSASLNIELKILSGGVEKFVAKLIGFLLYFSLRKSGTWPIPQYRRIS